MIPSTTNWTGIRITRVPYEEPYTINLIFATSNGFFSGAVEIYCETSELRLLGQRLAELTGEVDQKLEWSYGGLADVSVLHSYLSISVKPQDSTGHYCLEITMSAGGTEGGRCSLKLHSDTSSINELGNLLVEFSELSHQLFEWPST
jgi:hypothetical protein